MTQATTTKPVVEIKTCSNCPRFNNFYEANGRGWCEQFDRQAREHHEITNDCLLSLEPVVSVELEDNLAFFPNIDFKELDAFPTKAPQDPNDLPHSEYEVGSIVKVIDRDEDHTEWAVFEVIECMHNKNLYDSTENYLNQTEWYYRLRTYCDGNTMPSNNSGIDPSLWVAQNEICSFDMSWNVCTDDIF